MQKELKILTFWKFLVSKLKLILVLVFLFILAISFHSSLMEVKANNLGYNENFSTTTYEDAANTSAKWDSTAGLARLWGKEGVNMARTQNGPENISNTVGLSTMAIIKVGTNNIPYVIWIQLDGGINKVFFTKWTEGAGSGICGLGLNDCWTNMAGDTAGPEDIYPISASAAYAKLLLDGNNNPNVIWWDPVNGKVDFMKWTPATNAWTGMNGSSAYDVVPGVNAYPDFALDSNNIPYVTSEGLSGLPLSTWNGSAWSKMDGHSGYDLIPGGITAKPVIKIDSDNNPYIFYYDFYVPNNYPTFVRWKTGDDGSVCGAGHGACWTNFLGDTAGPEIIDPLLNGNGFYPQLELDRTTNPNTPFVSWTYDLTREIYFSKGTPGVGWTTMAGLPGGENVSNNAGYSGFPRLALDSNHFPYLTWIDDTPGNAEIFFTHWDGTKWATITGGAGTENVSNSGVVSRNSRLSINADNIPFITWDENTEIYLSKGIVSTGWTNLHDILGADNLSNDPVSSGYSSQAFDNQGNLDVVWEDGDIQFTKVLPQYTTPAQIQSLNVNSSSDYVTSAKLTTTQTPNYLMGDADGDNKITENDEDILKEILLGGNPTCYDLNHNPINCVTVLDLDGNGILDGPDLALIRWLIVFDPVNDQIINYFLSNDGGTTWEPTNPGDNHIFSSQGTDLRWRAVLTTTDPNITPLIDDLNVVYQTKKIICSLTPTNLTAGQSVTINASVTFAPARVWATIENSGNLLATVDLAGSGGNYTVSAATNNNYNGQNDVAVFASDGTNTYTCNPGDGTSWQKMSVNDIPWHGRVRHDALSFNNKIWILGGYTDKPSADIWSSADGANWTKVTDNAPWGARNESNAIVFGNKIWLMGGYNDPATYLNDVWSSVDGINWIQVTASAAWSARSSFGLAVYNNKMWISGGCTHHLPGNLCDTNSNDVWSSGDGLNWVQATSSALWSNRAAHQMFSFNDGTGEKLWLMGGLFPNANGTYFNDIWTSTNGSTWTQLTPGPHWSTRAQLGAVIYNNKIWLLGGRSPLNNLHNDIWTSSDGISWTQEKADVPVPGMGVQPSLWTHWTPRRSFGLVAFNNGSGNKLWLIGGYDGIRCENDVWSSIDGVNWILFNTNYEAEYGPRFQAATIAYQNKLWLMGGYVKLGGLANDVWSSTDGIHWQCEFGPYTVPVEGIACNHPAPSWTPRFYHHLVVFNDGTGDKIYLMGGCATTAGSLSSCPGAANNLRDVWAFDGTNWTLKINPAAWVGRFGDAVVAPYLGKIWVLGGYAAGVGYLNDVWNSADGVNWVHILTNPLMWSPRTGHSAVSFDEGSGLGDKLWLMGGYNGAYLHDVWSTRDGISWTQINPSAAWSGRYTFGLVNYNDKMWVFSGNSGVLPNGLYTNNVWSSNDGLNWTMATNNAPWDGRDFLSYAIFDNRIWLTGGDSNAGSNSDVWATSYDYLHFTVGISSPRPAGIDLPASPTGLSCSAQSNSVIRWSFTDNASDETGFRLHGDNSMIAEVNLADQTFMDESSLQTNTQYKDRQVTAFNNGGESELSNTASCYTLANKPSKIEVHTADKASLSLDIELTDGNPANTEYAIKELNSGQYVQADGTFGDNAVWQTESGWGGENAIKVVGGQASANSNVNGQVAMSLAENTEYSFSAKARNGDGVETEFSDPVVATTGQAAPTAPQLVVSKGVAINLAKAENHLVNNLIKTARAQSGVVASENNDSHLVSLLRQFSVFLIIILGLLLALLCAGLHNIARYLAPKADWRKKLSLGWQVLSQEPAKVFSEYAERAVNGTYSHAYEKHRSLHVFSQKNLKRLIGLALIDILILSYITISLNHQSEAQTAPYDQSGQEVKVGDKLSYIIEVENQGTGEATGIVIADILNSNLSYIANSAKINNNGTETTTGITVSGQDLSFNLGELEASQQGYVTFKAKVKAGSEDKTITNSAQVSGSNFTALATNTTSNHVQAPVPPTNTNQPPTNTNQPPTNTNVPPVIPPSITPPTQPPVIPIIGSIMQNETLQLIAQSITSPETKKASQNVVTPILLTIAAINTIPTVIVLTSYLLPYLNLLFVEPLLLFFRKKRKKWGVVYDSLSKLPIGLALVRLYDKKDNKLVQTKVTDRDGRYLMIVKEPGRYYLSVSKPDYEYPTRYLSEEKQDTKYIDLYHGEEIEVKAAEGAITANIPLDPKEKKAISAAEAVRIYLANNLRLIISYLGIILALIVILIYPTAITIGSLIIHVIFFILFRRLIMPSKPKSWGIVYDEKDKQPLHYALVRIFDTKFNKLLETQVTDSRGRYSFLVGKNEYQLLTEKAGYLKKEIKPVDLVNKESIVNLDVGLQKS